MDPADRDPFEEAARQRAFAMRAHGKERGSEAFQAEVARLRRVIADFAGGLAAVSLYGTRVPSPVGESLLLERADDLLEAALSIGASVHEGMHRPARREMRYVLEAAVKYLATDQACPSAPLLKRVAHFERELQYKSIGPASVLRFAMLSERTANLLREDLPREYDRLSSYVHASASSVRERLKAAAAGEYLGYETASAFRAANDEVVRHLDVVLAVAFHALDPALIGDVFTQVLDDRPEWTFHKTPLCAEISATFNDKDERSARTRGPGGNPD